MTSPVPDALRTQRQRAIDEHRIAQAVLDIESGSRRYPDVIAKVVAPLLARARAEGAADELERAAVLTVPSQDTAEDVREALFHRADHLRAALSAPTTTEGDPT